MFLNFVIFKKIIHRTMSLEEEKQKLIRAAYVPLLLLCIIWLIKVFEFFGGTSFSDLGIYPRQIEGLKGILFAPLVHGGWLHLIHNSVPLVVLATALFYFYRFMALKITILVWLITGLCVWIGGRSYCHIGASGVIYGIASFLFFSGVFRNNIKLLAISLVTVFLYGGMVWGILPLNSEISWESHLFGALTGLLLALIYKHEGPQKEVVAMDEDEEKDEYPYWEEGNLIDADNDPEMKVKSDDHTLNMLCQAVFIAN